MPELLLELFCEEIPARMQRRASQDLQSLVTNGLVNAGLTYEGAKAFATPRRLALTVQGLTACSPDISQERKGPKTSAPQAAIAGFLKAAGLTSVKEARIINDPKKGDYYVARITKLGQAAEEIIAELIPQIIREFPWPKSMRWGARSREAGALRWVRPLQSILCVFGPENESPQVIDFTVGGITSGNITYGHRFLAPEAIPVRRFDDYASKLEAAKVVLDGARREAVILEEARHLAFAQNLMLVEDAALLREVAGLVEWPVVLMGRFDEKFLSLPDEVIRLTIRTHQKCFVLKDERAKALMGRFILAANMAAPDGGAKIAAGNERVVRARLADALFFWENDLKIPLEARVDALKNIVFHDKLGTQFERVERIQSLACALAPLTGANINEVERAAWLCKADLVTDMVGEFPELQGTMGRYYAEAQGESPAVAAACEQHYRPQGPSDLIPTDPVCVTVALADKLDILVGFWAIDETPTSSKDPYALRRAALGFVRLIIENSIHFSLHKFCAKIFAEVYYGREYAEREEVLKALKGFESRLEEIDGHYAKHIDELIKTISDPKETEAALKSSSDEVLQKFLNLSSFLRERIKYLLSNQGYKKDHIEAALPDYEDDLLLIAWKVEALSVFLGAEDGAALLAGAKRAANILEIEEKKDNCRYSNSVDPGLLIEPEEKTLAEAIDVTVSEAQQAVQVNDFTAAMAALAKLRRPIDAFFDHVMVNAPDIKLRANRLNLLNQIRVATLTVADFSKIKG